MLIVLYSKAPPHMPMAGLVMPHVRVSHLCSFKPKKSSDAVARLIEQWWDITRRDVLVGDLANPPFAFYELPSCI